MPISPRNKQFLIVGIMVAVIILGVYLGYLQYQQVSLQNKKVKTASAEYKTAETELASLKELNEKMKTMSVELGKAQQVLPSGLSTPDLLANLEAMAIYSGITFDSVSFDSSGQTLGGTVAADQDTTVPPGVKTLPFTVSVAGNYTSLKKYLDAVEKNLRLIDVDSIVVGEGGIYTISMQAYYVD
jgi:Tfp pilus assembly protein PilO